MLKMEQIMLKKLMEKFLLCNIFKLLDMQNVHSHWRE